MSDAYSLTAGITIVTHDKDDAWRVAAGSVLVYVAPWKNEAPGRRAYLYEAGEGEVIPSLCFRDYEYTEWRFCLVATHTAEVTVIKGGNTSVLRKRFAQRAKLSDIEQEGFEHSILNSYKMTIVAEDGLIHKTTKENAVTSENTLRLIYNVFHKRKMKIHADYAGDPLYDAVSIICGWSGIPLAPLVKITGANPKGYTVGDIARVSHFSCREVILEENWFKTDSGVLLTFGQDGAPIACIPKGQNSYIAHYPETGERKLINSALAGIMQPKAYSLYRPLPNKPVGTKDLLAYCLKSVNAADVVQVLLFTAICIGVGLLLPWLNLLLFDYFIPTGAGTSIIQLGFVVLAAMIGSAFTAIAKNIANFRVGSRVGVDLECAMQDRLFNLPIRFIRRYESADLAFRLQGASKVAGAVANAVLGTGLTAVLSIAYFIMMLFYSARLALAGVLMLVIYGALLLLISGRERKIKSNISELDGKANSALYQHINGISKLRMSGAENRALFEYLKIYVDRQELDGRRNIAASLSAILTAASGGLFSVVLYWLVVRGDGISPGVAPGLIPGFAPGFMPGLTPGFLPGVTPGEFIAFISAFGLFSGALTAMLLETIDLRRIRPDYMRCKPILAETPEYDETKELPGDISGAFELKGVTFSYSPDRPAVINDVSLRVRSGEYIGIVGPSGCGKSTLLKLLLGFEIPDTGKIFYDGKDVESLDKRELRKKMGVVLQDGKLISGSIFENITITSPSATLSDAQRVAREVGLEEDLKLMPMGLHTMLSEEHGTISGGQQQRIQIARAIINKPRVLFFDEATSALDNKTQALICENLEKMNATRVVIAHRLSTIINCDRIIVMDEGRIIEQGTFSELMEAGGLFYELAKRQLL